MLTHCWQRVPPRRRAMRTVVFRLAAPIIAAMLLVTESAQADPRPVKIEEVDTEHMFGFTEGSEIGEQGENELLGETNGRFGRGTGAYHQVASTLEAKHTFTERFRLSAAATLAYYDISDVAGLGDQNQVVLQSVSMSARYRVLDHAQAPF